MAGCLDLPSKHREAPGN